MSYSSRSNSQIRRVIVILEAVNNSYAQALAQGGRPGDLYAAYLAEREAVINKFRLDAIAVGKDYTQQAPTNAPALEALPRPAPPFPPPLPTKAASMPSQAPTPPAGVVPVQNRRDRPSRAAKVTSLIGAAILAVVGIAVAVSTTASSTSTSRLSSENVDDSYSSLREVVYEVEGSASSVDITMETSSGTSQQQNLKVPLRSKSGETGLHVSMSRGDFVYISAQNQGKSGTVTCKITVDGVLISKVTSSGQYAIASCDGTVP